MSGNPASRTWSLPPIRIALRRRRFLVGASAEVRAFIAAVTSIAGALGALFAWRWSTSFLVPVALPAALSLANRVTQTGLDRFRPSYRSSTYPNCQRRLGSPCCTH